ncbi:MAG: hypothetical protein ACLSVD_13525 [Eggerthellaceae bacterium]
MHADTDDLATLLKMQHIDLEIMRANKKLQELPQRAAILEARTKRRGIEQKRAQLEALHADADARLARISDEDGALVEKQRRVQEEIDATRGLSRRGGAHQGAQRVREAAQHVGGLSAVGERALEDRGRAGPGGADSGRS